MSDQHELGRLRHVGLAPFDVKILTLLMETSGEFGLYVGAIDAANLPRVIAGLDSLAHRGLIAVDEARSTTIRIVLLLTDAGREVCKQLERMSVQPRVAVQMHGDMPEVVEH